MTAAERAQAVRGQLEYYFSRDNLQQDQYMVSQMNSQMYVGAHVLASYRKMVLLGASEQTIVQAARASALVDVSPDGKALRPAGNQILEDSPLGIP